MTTENTGSHDPDYNISVSSAPDRIPEGYVPPEGSPAAQTYDPNRFYPEGTHKRAMDTGGSGIPDPMFLYPDHPPNMDQDMLHKILAKVADQYVRFGALEDIVLKQNEKIDEIIKLLSDPRGRT